MRKVDHPSYNSWRAMKQRCDNPSCIDFQNYGGKLIGYIPTWKTFEGFVQDMGECPKGQTLHRLKNEQGYSKENCKWATGREQRLTQNRVPGKSGVFGVYRLREINWIARTAERAADIVLYYGQDFFEAVCARKSWENTREWNSIGVSK